MKSDVRDHLNLPDKNEQVKTCPSRMDVLHCLELNDSVKKCSFGDTRPFRFLSSSRGSFWGQHFLIPAFFGFIFSHFEVQFFTIGNAHTCKHTWTHTWIEKKLWLKWFGKTPSIFCQFSPWLPQTNELANFSGFVLPADGRAARHLPDVPQLSGGEAHLRRKVPGLRWPHQPQKNL